MNTKTHDAARAVSNTAERRAALKMIRSARKSGPRRFHRLGEGIKHAARHGAEPWRYLDLAIAAAHDFSTPRSRRHAQAIYDALDRAYAAGARERGRRAAERHLAYRGHVAPAAVDYFAENLVMAVAWAARLSAEDVETITLEALGSVGWELSVRGLSRLGTWSKQAVRERPEFLDWVPPKGAAWPELVVSNPFEWVPASGEALKNAPKLDDDFWLPGEQLVPPELPRHIEAAENLETNRPAPVGRLDLRPRLPVTWFDPSTEIAPPSWLVKGLLPRAGLGMIVGESGAGKSFLSVQLALCVAWGLPFMGRRIAQGGIAYIAAEGGMSLHTRFGVADAELSGAIYAENLRRRDKGLPPLERAPISIIPQAPDLSRNGGPKPLEATLEDMAADMAARGSRLALVVVDTLHAAMNGADENSASDMGHALAPLRLAAETHDTHVLVVHHLGKVETNGSRGSSALPAAADAIVALKVPGREGLQSKSGALRRATVTKVRDGKSGGGFAFNLKTVEIGHDEDGDPITSCVIQPIIEPEVGSDGLTDLDREFMGVVRACMVNGRCAVHSAREAWFASRKGLRDTVRRLFNRAKELAIKAGRLEIGDDELWFALPV